MYPKSLDDLDDFVSFIADIALDGRTARFKKGKRKGERVFSPRELGTLHIQRAILLESVAALKAALAQHADGQRIFRQALSAVAIIASFQVENPAMARMRDGNAANARKKITRPRSLALAESVARHATPILLKHREYPDTKIARSIFRKVNNDLEGDECRPVQRRAITNRVVKLRASLSQRRA